MNTPVALSNGCIVIRSLTHGDTFAARIPEHFRATIEDDLRRGMTHAMEVLACELVLSWAFEEGERYTYGITTEQDPGAARLTSKVAASGRHLKVTYVPDDEMMEDQD